MFHQSVCILPLYTISTEFCPEVFQGHKSICPKVVFFLFKKRPWNRFYSGFFFFAVRSCAQILPLNRQQVPAEENNLVAHLHKWFKKGLVHQTWSHVAVFTHWQSVITFTAFIREWQTALYVHWFKGIQWPHKHPSIPLRAENLSSYLISHTGTINHSHWLVVFTVFTIHLFCRHFLFLLEVLSRTFKKIYLLLEVGTFIPFFFVQGFLGFPVVS